MAPTRTHSSEHASTSKAPKAASSKHHHRKPYAPPPDAPAALPGVQKIKASLRQTRRLLAKDKLAADVRVATERRLKALEADLARAELARTERAMATRYHKVKFFERQKVARRLQQALRKLADAGGGGTKKKKLEARVAALRVDLNYVLHYPKTKKYISLFPPEVRKGKADEDEEGEDGGEGEEREDETSATAVQREETRQWVREQMDAGTLSWEPELELVKGADRQKRTGVDNAMTVPPEKRSKKAGKEATKQKPVNDEFFEDDAEDDGSEDEEDLDSD